MTRYLEAFFRNRWLIIIPAILLLCSGASLVLLVPKQYEAETTIWTETSAYFEDVLNPNPWVTPVQVESGRFRELIQTDTFTRAIVDRTPTGVNGTEEARNKLVDEIQNGLHIQTSGDHLLWITFAHGQPEVALAVVEVAIEEYNRVMADRAEQQAAQAIALYRERVAAYESEIIPRSGQAVADYLERHPEVRSALRERGSTADPGYALLDQQARLDRAQYEQYKQRLEEVLTQSQESRKSQEVAFRVMDMPQLKHGGEPKLNMKIMLMLAAGGVGVSFGYVVLFLTVATALDRTMRSSSDVQRTLQLPVLEVIPDYSVDARASKFAWLKSRKQSRWMPRTVSGQASNNTDARGLIEGVR